MPSKSLTEWPLAYSEPITLPIDEPGDHVDWQTGFLQGAENADMRPAPRRPSTKRQADLKSRNAARNRIHRVLKRLRHSFAPQERIFRLGCFPNELTAAGEFRQRWLLRHLDAEFLYFIACHEIRERISGAEKMAAEVAKTFDLIGDGGGGWPHGIQQNAVKRVQLIETLRDERANARAIAGVSRNINDCCVGSGFDEVARLWCANVQDERRKIGLPRERFDQSACERVRRFPVRSVSQQNDGRLNGGGTALHRDLEPRRQCAQQASHHSVALRPLFRQSFAGKEDDFGIDDDLDIGHALLAGEEGELAESFGRLEHCDRFAVGASLNSDCQAAGFQEIDRVAVSALFEQDGARGVMSSTENTGEFVDFFRRHAAEDRAGGEECAHFVHRSLGHKRKVLLSISQR